MAPNSKGWEPFFMKRISPKTNKIFKYGDVREDGFMFVSFKTTRPLKKDGFFQEYWLHPNKFEIQKKYKNENGKNWKLKHPERVKKTKAIHAKLNSEQYAAKTAKRRAAKLQRTPCWLTSEGLWLIEEYYHLAQKRTELLGFPWHVDHIIPLQGRNVSGLHVPENLQVIPGIENIKKSNKYDNWGI